MSRIRSKNTALEKRVFSRLRSQSIYFQKHYKGIAGNPDIALPRKKKAVFIDGDFWHGYKFDSFRKRLPEFWENKIENNIKRDKRNRTELKQADWKVLRIWEHDVEKNFDSTIEKIERFLIEK